MNQDAVVRSIVVRRAVLSVVGFDARADRREISGKRVGKGRRRFSPREVRHWWID